MYVQNVYWKSNSTLLPVPSNFMDKLGSTEADLAVTNANLATNYTTTTNLDSTYLKKTDLRVTSGNSDTKFNGYVIAKTDCTAMSTTGTCGGGLWNTYLTKSVT